MRFRYAYLHGFASSPLSRKGVVLRHVFATRGLTLHAPDLNVPSFERLTISAMVEAVDRLDEEVPGEAWRFIGSSMGGYLAALWTSLHPDRVDRLVLLAPGFDMADRWPDVVGRGNWERWEREGELPLPDASGTPRPLHWGFVLDGRKWPQEPAVSCPTLVIHGVQDVVVPPEVSARWGSHQADVRRVEVDDEHQLLCSMDVIERECLSFFGLG